MDKLAAALGIDPVELRLLNAIAPGDTLPTGQRIDRLAAGRRGDPRRRRARAARAPRSCRATRSACPAAPATRRAARASAAASASRSASRTSASRRASTTTAPRACGCSTTARPRSSAPPPRSGRACTNVMLQVARTELGIDDVAARAALDRERRLGRLDLGLAADVDGRRRRARRLPRGARRARGARRRRGRRRARLPPPADDAARPRDGPDHGRARPRRASPSARCGSSPRSTSSSA